MDLKKEIVFHQRLLQGTSDRLSDLSELLDTGMGGNEASVQRMFDTIKMSLMTDVVIFPARGVEMIYVLLLEGDKYYVGYSGDIHRRLYEHFNGRGSIWTKRYKPLRLVEMLPGGKGVEKEKTLEYMRNFGWQHVRGGPYTQISLTMPSALNNDVRPPRSNSSSGEENDLIMS
jgi:hypothetical protein